MIIIVRAIIFCIALHLTSSCLAPPPAPTQPPTSAPTKAPSSTPCRCGAPAIEQTRIVGGQNAKKQELPWQVALVRVNNRPWVQNRPFCGGTLLSSRTVLTAAHCQVDPSQFLVVVGEHDVSTSDGEQQITPASWLSHPDYNSNTQDNDFAIIQLTRDVTLDNSVMPACLPDPSLSYDDRSATVSGWGTLSSGGSQPNILQEVEVKTMSNNACMSYPNTYPRGAITDNMICAANEGKDSCQGDSGGPLVTKEKSRYYSVIGVVSWGYGCAQDGAPGVYSRVTEQREWILKNIQGSTCPKP